MTTSTYRILNDGDDVQPGDIEWNPNRTIWNPARFFDYLDAFVYAPLHTRKASAGDVILRPQPDEPRINPAYLDDVLRSEKLLKQRVSEHIAELYGARAQVKVLEKTIDAQKAVNASASDALSEATRNANVVIADRDKRIAELEKRVKFLEFHNRVAETCIQHNTTLREQGLVSFTTAEKAYRLLANGETLQYGDEVLMVADGRGAKKGEWRCLDHSGARGIVGKSPADCTFRRPLQDTAKF